MVETPESPNGKRNVKAYRNTQAIYRGQALRMQPMTDDGNKNVSILMGEISETIKGNKPWMT